MELVLSFLDAISPLEDDLRNMLLSAIRTTRPVKDTVILREGSVAHTINFIEKGLIRGYRITDKGNEVTSWFMKEKDIFISIRSFLTQTPAKETIQTLENCIIHSITYSQFRSAHTTYRSFDRIRGDLLEKYYLLAEERNEMHQQEDTYLRYCYLMEHYPDLADRVSDKYLASFMNTTPEYFSSIKSEYRRRNNHR